MSYLQDLLDYSRVEAGRLAYRIAPLWEEGVGSVFELELPRG